MIDVSRPGNVGAITKTRPVAPGKIDQAKDRRENKKRREDSAEGEGKPRRGGLIDERC